MNEEFIKWAAGRLYSYSAYRHPLKGNATKVYEVSELKELLPLFLTYQSLWELMASAHKDWMCGSCVVGDGIFVLVRPKRARSAFPFKILSTQSEMTGSLAWGATKDDIIKGLQSQGIECFYRWGNLD